MNKERILRLANYMDSLDRRSYNQETWLLLPGSRLTPSNEELGETIPANSGRSAYRKVIPEGACGTVACVLGHAVFALPDAGLFFACEKELYNSDNFISVASIDEGGEILFTFEAGARALDIPLEHACVLFSADINTYRFYAGGLNPTPKDVASALRKYVETDGASIELFIDGEW